MGVTIDLVHVYSTTTGEIYTTEALQAQVRLCGWGVGDDIIFLKANARSHHTTAVDYESRRACLVYA